VCIPFPALALARMSTVNHRVVEVNIRSQGLVACEVFHIPTGRLKERKRTKKKETATTIKTTLLLPKPIPNTYNK
jgi:hypothetical protein